MPIGKVQFCPSSKVLPVVGKPADAISPRVSATPLKVLVVDDEPDVANLTADLLMMYSTDVVIAYSGIEALRILQQDPGITAMLSDVMMPGMTGLELAAAVSQAYPRVKIVLTSGYVFPSVRPNNLGYPFVSKPFRIEAVLSLLRDPPTQQ